MKCVPRFLAAAAALSILAGSGCSINRLAVRAISNALSSEGSSIALTGDDDPDLVADALPFALKLYEILLEQDPENAALLLTAGSGFIMYANAFVQTPAEMLPYARYEEQVRMMIRATKLYLRGRDYVLRSLESKHDGFIAAVDSGDLDSALAPMTPADTDALYWAGAGWMAAISLNTFDIALGVGRPNAAALIDKAFALNPDYGAGTLHEFYISYYAGLPESMGGSDLKAREHYRRALDLSGGRRPSVYVALATALSIKNQDHEEFIMLLEKALAIDPEEDPANRLASVIAQRKARWLLDHIEDFFLI